MNVHVRMNGDNKRQHDVLLLADAIETRFAWTFNLRCWEDCIAGCCAQLFGGSRHDPAPFAQDFLGLDDKQADVMFTPEPDELGLPKQKGYVLGSVDHMYVVSPKWAANMLRAFAFTGKVDWIGTRPDGTLVEEIAGCLAIVNAMPLPAQRTIMLADVPALTARTLDPATPVAVLEMSS